VSSKPGTGQMDDTSMRSRLALASLPAKCQQLLTEQNVFRALTLILFCSVVFSLLFYSDFLPFGTDNNETFSSILHAKNMYLHGIGSTYGLTSEATSPIDTVQFVYTHQGNFPRFYALLLYALGARSAEAQILITSLTIGSVSILFAHIYMERRVNGLFAFVFCSVLITDYIMSLQWLVNTWRVWHFFFFFSSLLLAHAFADTGSSKRRTVVDCSLLFINFACLFYFELIFAAFVATFFGLYLAFLLWRQPQRLVLGWAVSALGSALAVALLCVQGILYLGSQDFLSDLTYTFLSRNVSRAASPAEFAAFKERVMEFMRQHNIVFWDNFASSAGLRGAGEMLRLFYRFSLAPQTPMLVLLTLLLTVSAWLRGSLIVLRVATPPMLRSNVIAWMRGRVRGDNAAMLLAPAFVLFGSAVTISGTSYGITDDRYHLIVGSSIRFISASVVITGATVLFASVCRRLIIKAGMSSASIYDAFGTAKLPAASLLVIVTFISGLELYSFGVAALTVLLWAMTSCAAMLWISSSRCALTNARLVLAIGFLLAFAAFAHYHAWLYQPIHYDIAAHHFEPFWLELIVRLGGHTLCKIVILATALLSTLIILGVMDYAGVPESMASLARIVPYWLIGMAAYVIVFAIAPGYIYSAYLVRNAPFAVYLSALPVAGAVCVLCSLVRHLPRQFMGEYRPAVPALTVLMAARAVLVCGVLAAVVGTWLAVQAIYLRRIPPERVAPMFHALEKVAGASTVVSTYATPVAIATGQWSYYDPAFFNTGPSFDGHGYHVSPRDWRYLWFGDWKSNSAYRTPGYFVCWLHLYFHDVVSTANRRTCGRNFSGLREIRQGKSIFDHKEVFRDEKYDLWSIVKLDWDYPPYLGLLDESSPDTRMRVSVVGRADGIGFTVEIDPQQQEGRPIVGVHYRLYAEAGDNPTCEFSSRGLTQSADSPADLWLPKEFKGCLEIGVAPFTATKTGAEYYSAKVMIGIDVNKSR
jgi:hypothetical protein